MTGLEVPLLIAAVSVTAYSEYQRGKTAAAQAKQEAAWHDYNARVAMRNAAAERQNAAAEQRAVIRESLQQKRRGKALMAKQRAMIGASGVQMPGSPLLVAVDTARELALENAMIREAGQRRVTEYGRRAEAYRAQSILDISKASASRSAASGYGKAALLGAGTSILEGGTQVAKLRTAGSPWWPTKKKTSELYWQV